MKNTVASSFVIACALTLPIETNALNLRRLDGHVGHDDEMEMAPIIGLAIGGLPDFASANVAGGIMRGFQQHMIDIDGEERPAMEGFDLISGASGGNFANILFHFASNTTSDDILDAGGMNDPSNLTAAELEYIPENSLFHPLVQKIWGPDSLPSAMRETFIEQLSSDADISVYEEFLISHFLDHFNIPSQTLLGGFNDSASGEFVTVREDVASTPIITFSMTGPSELYPEWVYTNADGSLLDVNVSDTGVNISIFNESFIVIDSSSIFESMGNYTLPIPFYCTPDSFGSLSLATMLEYTLMESNSSTLVDFAPYDISPMNVSMTMEKLLGFGTYYFAGEGFRAVNDSTPVDLPHMFEAPLVADIITDSDEARSMSFADGGSFNDYTGIPALVQMGVTDIIFVCPVVLEFESVTPEAAVFALFPYFGIGSEGEGMSSFSVNGIFDANSNGVNQLERLAEDLFLMIDAGNPQITTLHLVTVDNPFWSIEGGMEVELTVIVPHGVPSKFSDLLPIDIATPPEGRNLTENGFFTNEELMHVPNLPSGQDVEVFVTFFGITLFGPVMLEGAELGLEPKSARMSQILCSWMIKEAWEGLEDSNGTMIFGGFSEIFNPPIMDMNGTMNETEIDMNSTIPPLPVEDEAVSSASFLRNILCISSSVFVLVITTLY